ncbi:MAG: hypothetical protein PVG11_08740, partial [Anaerolineae bacterium]
MALHNLNNVTIEGPAWSARARVHHLDDPAQPGGGGASTSAALRALFVESVDPRRLYEPGTVLALCAATHVDIKLEGETYQWRRPIGLPIPGTGLSPDGIAAAVRDGILSLLLLERGERDDTFTCLAGEIGLRGVEDQPGLRALYGDIDLEEQPEAALTGRRGAARLPATIAVHASGLSILGRIALPWQPDLLPGVFRLTPAFATGLPGGSANRLLVELDRLMPEERRALLGAWRALGRSLNPRNPAHAAGGLARKPAPVWVTLDVADPASLPHLSWEITPGEPVEGSAHFRGDLLLAPGEVTLALSDQHPNDVQHPPTSLAYVHLADVRLRAVGGALQVEVNTGPEPGPDAGAGVPGIELRYVADLEAGAAGWHERFALAVEDPDDAGAPAGTGAAFAFDPVGVPRVLRRQQRLPLPVWEPPGRREEEEEPEPVDPAVVWGFMPVDGGWAQLPVPNLTEQMYVDTGLAQLGAHLSSSPADGVRGAAKRTPFRGAVAYGNQPPAQAAVESGPVGRPQGPAVAEQLWSLTIT